MASVHDNWHVEQTRPDGARVRQRSARYGRGKRWVVRWRDQDDAPHKRFFDRKTDAEREASRIESDLARRTYLDPRAGEITFQRYTEQWLDGQFADPNTTYQVRSRLRLHVHPVLGHLAMQVVTPSDIRRWLRGLTMARSYQRTIFANVSQIFSAAVADEIIARNPCRSPTVRKPVPDPTQVVPWSSEQVAAVHAALPDRYAVLVPLAAGVGLRQGEILGLSSDDLDHRRGTITVRRQVKLTPSNQPYLALPKGRKIRTVPLPDTVHAALHAHLQRHPSRTLTLPWGGIAGPPQDVALVLTTREHKPVNRHYFNARIWKPALAAHGIPTTRDNGCHALRHYYASVLLDGGESIKTVSERLGHADPGFTLRTYTHLLPHGDARTRSIIDAALQLPALNPPAPTRPSTAPAPRNHGPTRARRPTGGLGPQR